MVVIESNAVIIKALKYFDWPYCWIWLNKYMEIGLSLSALYSGLCSTWETPEKFVMVTMVTKRKNYQVATPDWGSMHAL